MNPRRYFLRHKRAGAILLGAAGVAGSIWAGIRLRAAQAVKQAGKPLDAANQEPPSTAAAGPGDDVSDVDEADGRTAGADDTAPKKTDD